MSEGWPVTDLSPVAAEVDRLARDMTDVFMGRTLPSTVQPRVPRSVTETAQERPRTESTHDTHDETGEMA